MGKLIQSLVLTHPSFSIPISLVFQIITMTHLPIHQNYLSPLQITCNNKYSCCTDIQTNDEKSGVILIESLIKNEDKV